jgi:hypothetical protein
MDVFILTCVLDSREIEVDDVHDVANVETTSRDASSNKDWAFANAE